ncbi:MAG: tyrosine-type recombinase/integrase [Geminicoccaceae bacterium]
MKLTKATVAKLAVPDGKSEAIFFDEDMPGFGLRLRAGGSAVWITQYRIGAKQRRVTLGKLATLDPDRARKAAREVLAKADLGQDAQAERRESQARAAVTFGSVVDLYLKRAVVHRKPKTVAECRRHLERDWRAFHQRPVHAIERRDVAARLQTLADEHGPVASNRARAALSACYGWAIGQGLADATPVVGTTRVGIERERERVLTSEDIVTIWPHLGEEDHARIVKLLLLTGQRRGEVAGLAWSEVSFDRALWSLPAARTKNALPHDVPLSPQAVAILSAVPRREMRNLLFGEGDGPFSGWSLAKKRLDRRIARARAEARLGRPLLTGEQPQTADFLTPWTLHDLRRTVVTGMNELGIQPHIVEAVVNHVSGRAKAGVAGVYNRATYATEKRMALQAWADHLDEVLGLGERKVIPMRA